MFGQLEGEEGEKEPNAPSLRTRFGTDHFGFAVENMEESVADLRAKGVTILVGPYSPRAGMKICLASV